MRSILLALFMLPLCGCIFAQDFAAERPTANTTVNNNTVVNNTMENASTGDMGMDEAWKMELRQALLADDFYAFEVYAGDNPTTLGKATRLVFSEDNTVVVDRTQRHEGSWELVFGEESSESAELVIRDLSPALDDGNDTFRSVLSIADETHITIDGDGELSDGTRFTIPTRPEDADRIEENLKGGYEPGGVVATARGIRIDISGGVGSLSFTYSTMGLGEVFTSDVRLVEWDGETFLLTVRPSYRRPPRWWNTSDDDTWWLLKTTSINDFGSVDLNFISVEDDLMPKETITNFAKQNL